MHACNPQHTYACNAWCRPPHHVDLAYCDHDLFAELGVDPLQAFLTSHAASHAELYGTPPCTILAIVQAAEAPPMQRYYPEHGQARAPVAYRVTYQVHPQQASDAPPSASPD